MDINPVVAGSLIGGIGSFFAAIYYAQNVYKNFKHDQETFSAEIIQEAKEYTKSIEKDIIARREVFLTEIRAQIDELEAKVDNQNISTQKDMTHLRETYNGEIRVLGGKIEDLRSELRNQHGQLVGLLSKMLENRD